MRQQHLRHITFTGVDEMTDLKGLQELQSEYPIAEFSVLFSKNWKTNGNRYINPEYMKILGRKGLNLSCHACGSIARDALRGNWMPLEQVTNGMYPFKRCQLNIAMSDIKEDVLNTTLPVGLEEVIIQQRDADHLSIWDRIQNHYGMSILFDASGGNGIDTGFEPFAMENIRIGYAGGITPENVTDKLTFLLNNENVYDFWIDMESGVRTDDWFDLNKVAKVLEVCKPIIENHKNQFAEEKQ